MSIIFITGIKHSGKSVLSSHAAALCMKHTSTFRFDTDEIILDSFGNHATIRAIYQHEGKDRFMALEFEALQRIVQSGEGRLAKNDKAIVLVATGGGICDNRNAIRFMHREGKIVYLRQDESVLYERIEKIGIPPFLQGGDPRSNFHRLFEQRDSAYSEMADYVVQLIDLESIEHNAALLFDTILHIVEET